MGESLCSLPLLPGAPAVALVTIANAVGLFSRFTDLACLCESLLFKPYEVAQLRKIAGALLVATGSVAPMLGSMWMELRLREIARRSGDCRQVVCLCESAISEAVAREAFPVEGGAGTSSFTQSQAAPLKYLQRSGADPLGSVQSLPLEQLTRKSDAFMSGDGGGGRYR